MRTPVKLSDILGYIVAHPENQKLIEFTATFLSQPTYAERNKELLNIIKSQQSNPSSEGNDTEKPTKPHCFKLNSPDETLIAAITAKLEDGNICNATRILCDNNHPIEPNAESFAALQEKHSSNRYHEDIRCIQIPITITICLKITVPDVEQAINSFPKGSGEDQKASGLSIWSN